MLKFQLRKERFNFTAGWVTLEKQMIDDDADEDLLHHLLQGKFQDKYDSIMEAILQHED